MAARSRPAESKAFPTTIHERVDQCRRGVNPKTVARLASGWVVMGDTQMLAGYCLLLPDPVVPTLNDLDDAGRRQFLSDMARIGDAINALCKPRRLNYEMLGNLDPALHAHVFPRYEHERDDMRTKPVWLYGPEMFDNAAHVFDPKKHGALHRRIAKALESAIPSVDSEVTQSGIELWQRATSFAARAHRNQIRKDGVTPYVSHPYRVTMTVRDVFGESDPVTLAAALLHDTIEDTTCDYDELLELFGKPVADCVALLTKDMRLIEPERERAYDAQLVEGDWRSRLIKLADVYDNLHDLAQRTPIGLTEQVDRCKRAIAIVQEAGDTHPSILRATSILQHALTSGAGRMARSPKSASKRGPRKSRSK